MSGGISWRFVLFFALTIQITLVVFPAAAQRGPSAALVQVDAVRIEPLSQTFPVIGRLVARQSGVVAAQVSGPVEEVLVQVGDRVAAGDLLARIDHERLSLEVSLREADLAEAQANYTTLQASVALAQQQLERQQGLRGSASFSRARFDDATQELARARSALSEANARRARAGVRLELARLDLERAEIKAPYQGVVSLRDTEDGAYLSVGQPVVTLVDDNTLELEADVPTTRLAGLTPGTPVLVRLDDGSEHTAAVRALVPEENAMTRTRAVRLTPQWGASDKPLAANQSATIMVPVGAPRNVISVHKDAVINGPSGAIVYLIEGETASIRTVNLGESVGSRFEVLSGLNDGDLVVIRGNERLRPGQAVRYES